jgi:hypothetical protein
MPETYSAEARATNRDGGSTFQHLDQPVDGKPRPALQFRHYGAEGPSMRAICILAGALMVPGCASAQATFRRLMYRGKPAFGRRRRMPIPQLSRAQGEPKLLSSVKAHRVVTRTTSLVFAACLTFSGPLTRPSRVEM